MLLVIIKVIGLLFFFDGSFKAFKYVMLAPVHNYNPLNV